MDPVSHISRNSGKDDGIDGSLSVITDSAIGIYKYINKNGYFSHAESGKTFRQTDTCNI